MISQNKFLLPQKMSQQGPTIAVADINKDGLEDVFIGGGQDQSGAIYLQNATGNFSLLDQPVFETDKAFEDNGSLFFDADNDGDLDLYISSGGYDLAAGSPLLQDRLYENDGKGMFSRSGGLPKIFLNSKSVASEDFDNDGDNDLVIGGHCVPGKYPLADRSYILKNEMGTFVEQSELLPAELAEIGIVNELIFSDYDGDNDKDLIVVGEWIPITIFNNDGGIFSKVNVPELKDTNGWWYTISEIDFDNDGDLDYVVGNLGDNNKFHPTKEKPLHVYAKDFDNNNTFDMVLSKNYKGNLVPVRGKECSTQQNAFIEQKTPTFKDFANSSLVDIYGDQELKSSYHNQVYMFSSVYIENKGDDIFTIHKLPNMAQMGPTLGFEFGDVNKDGIQDIIGIGAIHETEVETIRYDANVGYIISGNPDGELESYKDINFYNDKNAKDIKRIMIKGKTHFLIANNNSALTVFKEQ